MLRTFCLFGFFWLQTCPKRQKNSFKETGDERKENAYIVHCLKTTRSFDV